MSKAKIFTDPKGNPTNKVRIPCRFNYMHLFDPDPFYEGQEKYTMTLIISKDDKETVALVKQAIKSAAEHAQGMRLTLAYDNQPLKDGDIGRPESDAFKNTFYISAKSNTKPKVKRMEVDRSITNLGPSDIKDGDYGCVIVSINPYAGKQGGKPGVGCYLNSVLWERSGEPLGGGLSDEDAFEGLDPAEHESGTVAAPADDWI